jgi:vancomycin resistance protein YoaR
MPFVTSPLTLTFEKNRWEVPTAELLSWLSYANNVMPVRDNIVENYYQIKPANLTYVDLDIGRIKSHLGSISKNINQPAKDALLTVEGERATVFQQSQDGRAVDLDMTAKTIAENVMSTTPAPDVPLTVVVTKADVTNDTIDQLGIKELLSEGVSYFPGSSANRITNIRVGSKRYNGVLLEPGEVFSFGEILGKVGPEQGYKEGRVILEGRTESQYGGGLCQVSSTAFRAALLAGLPILERYNHSFAVSYYTQPYGVPGVDATIYYPSVDFKFKNDTANHILIQTELVGTTLKFRFYGTKEKTGVIRGPNFIYGSNDPNQPSKTVFYRDIVVGGEVVKTNTIYTTYRSALDFPPVD